MALSALYELLLLHPQQGCSILAGLRESERSRRLTDTGAATTSCGAGPDELGWQGRAHEEILVSSYGLTPHPNPRSPLPASPPPPQRRQHQTTPPCPPTSLETLQTEKGPRGKRKTFQSGSSLSSDNALPCGEGKGVKEK